MLKNHFNSEEKSWITVGTRYLLDVNAAREEHVHELAVGGTRAQLLNFRIPRITSFVNYG
jgi:hypothetical protein